MVAKQVGDSAGVSVTVDMVFDYDETMAQKLEDLPAMVVDGLCVWSGTLPETAPFARWLEGYLARD